VAAIITQSPLCRIERLPAPADLFAFREVRVDDLRRCDACGLRIDWLGQAVKADPAEAEGRPRPSDPGQPVPAAAVEVPDIDPRCGNICGSGGGQPRKSRSPHSW